MSVYSLASEEVKGVVKQKSEKKKFNVPVHNLILMKGLIDADNNGVTLVGSFTQTVFNTEEINVKEEIVCKDHNFAKGVFSYRLNDEAADKDSGILQIRRTVETDTMVSTTFAVKAPMMLDLYFTAIPFKIVRAKLLIELGSVTGVKDMKTICPDLVIDEDKHKNNTCIRKDVYEMQDSYFNKNDMDKSVTYDFLSPFPNVLYFHTNKSDQCSKICLEFFLVTGGYEKFVEIICPMILVLVMNTMNVLHQRGYDKGNDDYFDFLANSATFALTAVFILPGFSSGSYALFTVNNIYIIIVTIALCLSSIPTARKTDADEKEIGKNTIAQVGLVIHYFSFVFPLFNLYRFRKLQNHIAGDMMEKAKDFYEGKGASKGYTRVSAIKENSCYKKNQAGGKFLVVKYATKEKDNNILSKAREGPPDMNPSHDGNDIEVMSEVPPTMEGYHNSISY